VGYVPHFKPIAHGTHLLMKVKVKLHASRCSLIDSRLGHRSGVCPYGLHVPRTFLRDNFISIGTNRPCDTLTERHMTYRVQRIDAFISMKQRFVEIYPPRLETDCRVSPRIPILMKAEYYGKRNFLGLELISI
jgi:hypothetical protein